MTGEELLAELATRYVALQAILLAVAGVCWVGEKLWNATHKWRWRMKVNRRLRE